LRNSLAKTESRVLFTFFLRIHRARKRPFNECWILISARPPPNNWGGCFRLVNFEGPSLDHDLEISWVRSSIDINLRSVDFPFKPSRNQLIRRDFNLCQSTFNICQLNFLAHLKETYW
jgi:hypothetical protein